MNEQGQTIVFLACVSVALLGAWVVESIRKVRQERDLKLLHIDSLVRVSKGVTAGLPEQLLLNAIALEIQRV